jgi:hypothetical protein
MEQENNQIILKALEKAKAEYEQFEGNDLVGNRAVFILCQYLQGVVDKEKVTAKELDTYIRQWYDLFDGQLVDDDGETLSYIQIWAQFIDVWENGRVKFSKIDHLATALERAKKYITPRPEVAHLNCPKTQLIAHTCFELQQLRQDGIFFISQEDAGWIIGKGQKQGRLIMNLLLNEGVFALIEKGRTGFASIYSYVENPLGSKGKRLTNTEFERKKKAIKNSLNL